MIGEEEKPKINPEFPTESLDNFINEFNQPKQNMDLDERPQANDEFDKVTGEQPEEAEIQMKAAPAKATAKMITAVIDNTLPAALGLVAKEDSNAFKASPEERGELVDALTEYVRLKGGDVPPGLMVIIIVLTIYGSKVPFAIQQRKLNKMREELEKTQADLTKREADIAAREDAQRRKEQEFLKIHSENTTENPENKE